MTHLFPAGPQALVDLSEPAGQCDADHHDEQVDEGPVEGRQHERGHHNGG